MSFINLIKHSLSIIAVFRIGVIVRSALFYIFYLFLISQNITIIMTIPLILIIVLIVAILIISRRENIEEFNNSLTNILDIVKIKS